MLQQHRRWPQVRPVAGFRGGWNSPPFPGAFDLGDPRSETMQKMLNLKVKYRESFRPFAPSILREDLADWFELDCDSPYMLLVADVKKSRRREMTADEQSLFGTDKLNVKRSDIPAVTHVDYSARIQTVHQETNPLYHALISAFKGLTGCPVLVNTSFNVRGEPIVCTVTDAFRCFMGTEIDMLIVGNSILHKDAQDSSLAEDYTTKYGRLIVSPPYQCNHPRLPCGGYDRACPEKRRSTNRAAKGSNRGR